MRKARVVAGKRLPLGLCTIEAPRPDGAVEQFFLHLARNCRVADAAGRSGLSLQEVTMRMRADPLFAARNADALDGAYRLLEWELLERARFGNRDPKTYNDAHALRMLAHHRAARNPQAEARPAVPRARLDGIVTRLLPALKGHDDD